MNGNHPAPASQILSGKRIVITRARAQAVSLARRIEEQGGEVIEFPTIEIHPPRDPRPLDEAVEKLNCYDWLMFTSANGVERFFECMAHHKRSVAELEHVQIAAIGPETAKRLEKAGVKNCLVPATYQAEGILDVLNRAAMRGKRVLIPRAAKAREILPETLRQCGAEVDVVETYRTVMPQADTAATPPSSSMVFFVIGPMQAIGVSVKISAKRCPSNSRAKFDTVLGLVNVTMSMARRRSVSFILPVSACGMTVR